MNKWDAHTCGKCGKTFYCQTKCGYIGRIRCYCPTCVKILSHPVYPPDKCPRVWKPKIWRQDIK